MKSSTNFELLHIVLKIIFEILQQGNFFINDDKFFIQRSLVNHYAFDELLDSFMFYKNEEVSIISKKIYTNFFQNYLQSEF